MIATDPYLQRFVKEFTETNNGKAFFAALTDWVHLFSKISKVVKEKRFINLFNLRIICHSAKLISRMYYTNLTAEFY